MKVLLIGNGAREHIIAEKLAKDAELYAVMSKKNPAIAELCKEFWIYDTCSPKEVAEKVKGKNIDLGFVSPDPSIAAGVTDALSDIGILMASPTKAAGRIEWDKSFMRGLMLKYNIEGMVRHELVNDKKEAERVVKEYGKVAVKPIGLTGGKGVKVSKDHFKGADDAVEYAVQLIKNDGEVLIEEELVGEEFTFQAFSDGKKIEIMPPVQDHKRAHEGDTGPNTGGMGSYSTGRILPFLEQSDIDAGERIIKQTIDAMEKEGAPFTGVLYAQFMATKNGPKVIEFNSRFGDPEAMNVLGLYDGSLSELFMSMAQGDIKLAKFTDKKTVVKYLVPEGYPEKPVGDSPVEVDVKGIESIGAKVYFASVYEKEGMVYTTKSRSFGLLGLGETLDEAEMIAEKACSMVKGKVWHRKDIGTKELVEKRKEHMKELRG